ncbi:retrovirus-related Pol polyprotein from transposon 17.6 [Trichonephila clavipes]|nr:retrovirus-related Pol polyprotein from transposon 17.6 [Trichonephila clavipes]
MMIKAIADFPRPTTKTQVPSFLGLVGYYSHYIPNYSTIASALTDKLKGKIKKEKITWDEKCEKAFEELKPNSSPNPYCLPQILPWISSCKRTGAKLQHVGKGISGDNFWSKAIKALFRRAKIYYRNQPQPLKVPKQDGSTNPRLERWALSLQPFNFEIKHKPGRLHGNADGLSRLE